MGLKRFRSRTFVCLYRPRSSVPALKALLFRLLPPLPREIRSWKDAVLDTCAPSPPLRPQLSPASPLPSSFSGALPSLLSPTDAPCATPPTPPHEGRSAPGSCSVGSCASAPPPPAWTSERGSLPLAHTAREKRVGEDREEGGGRGRNTSPAGAGAKAGASRSLYRGTACLDPNSQRSDRKIVGNPIRFWANSKPLRSPPVNSDATPAKSAPLPYDFETIWARFRPPPAYFGLPPANFAAIPADSNPFPAERIRPPPFGVTRRGRIVFPPLPLPTQAGVRHFARGGFVTWLSRRIPLNAFGGVETS